jgi:hypothetical protein
MTPRFWERIDASGGPDACWPWTGPTHRGYGVANGPGRRTLRAHRYAYRLAVGPIPEGAQIDHTCHNGTGCLGGPSCPHRRCCNPRHLEPTTGPENQDRSHNANQHKTHCPHNHAYTPENTYSPPRQPQSRLCRACNRERARHARSLTPCPAKPSSPSSAT